MAHLQFLVPFSLSYWSDPMWPFFDQALHTHSIVPDLTQRIHYLVAQEQDPHVEPVCLSFVASTVI